MTLVIDTAKPPLAKLQLGLSLIELLVSMFISVIIFAGVINSLLASKQAYLYDDEVAYIQENSRFALDYLSREIREAGYMGGCGMGSVDMANVLDLEDTDAAVDLLKPTSIIGYEGSEEAGDIFPASFSDNVSDQTDAFIIRRLDSRNPLTINNHTLETSMITLTTDLTTEVNDVLMLVSNPCRQVGLFAVSEINSIQKQIKHAQTDAAHNCTGKLGGSFKCTNLDNATDFIYPAGSAVYKVLAKAFYIGTSVYDDKSRSLFMRNLDDIGNVSSSELVGGVEDMQIEYGVNTEPGLPTNGEANQYLQANAINLNTTQGAPWIAWDRVVSARITLVMRSRNTILSQDTSKTMGIIGTTYIDKYLYQEVSTIVNLRNAALPANP